jgi:HSP20 family molecular chaperone IbpA
LRGFGKMAIKKKRSFYDAIQEYFDDMDREMDRWRESMIERPSWNQLTSTMEPLKDMRVTPTEVIVTVDLPFTKKTTLQVKPVDENTLEVSAKMRRKVTFKEMGITHHEGEFERFQAQMSIPVPVQMKKLEIKFKKGLLELHIPRKRAR